MRRVIVAFLLLCLSFTLVAQGFTVPFAPRPVSSGGCTPPTMTYRWSAYALTGTPNCGTGGGTTCTTSGQSVYSIPESVASNTATDSGTLGTYQTNAINGLPAISINSTSGYAMTTNIPSSVTTYTLYAIFSAGNASSFSALFGSASASNSIEYGLESSKQFLREDNNGPTAGGTTLSNNTWYTGVMTWNTASGAYVLYLCSAGTCSVDASGTVVTAPSDPITNLAGPSRDYAFLGSVAEWGYRNGIDSNPSSDIGAWSLCKFAH